MTKKNYTILIVDDSKTVREYIGNMLREYGIQVDFASCGIDAYKILQDNKYDLVLSDIIMPDINGIILCEKINATPDLAHIPIILMTGKKNHTNILKAIKAGAVDFIYKNFEEEELVARILARIEKSKSLKK